MLSVVADLGTDNPRGRRKLLVQCDCGSPPKTIDASNLAKTQSCGCAIGDGRGCNPDMDLDWLFDRCSPEPNSGCWLWTMSTKGPGYAQVGYRHRTSVAAHILAYEFKFGATPQGLELDHLCRVICCINPDHLEPVTHLENMLRGSLPGVAREQIKVLQAQRRQQTHCKRGHEFTPENTHIGKQGSRFCLMCRKARWRS